MDTIKVSNGKIITRNNLWSTCCCGPEPTAERFWEGIPCDLKRNIRGGACAEWDQCQLKDRIYIGENSRCQGEPYNICECQGLRIGNFRYGTGNLYNGFIWVHIPPTDDDDNPIPASSVVTDDFFCVGVSGVGSRCFSLTGSLENLYDAIVADSWYGNIIFDIVGENACDWDLYSGRILRPGVYYPTGTYVFWDSAEIPFRDPGMAFSYDGGVSNVAEYDPNPNVFAGRIQNVLTDLIGTGISVIWNSGVSTWNSEIPQKVNTAYFDIQFGGDLCGSRRSNIEIYFNSLRWETVPGQCLLDVLYGDYRMDETPFPLGSPPCDLPYYHVYGSGLPCPYECFGVGGPLRPSEVRCCPQRGGQLGPNQPISETISSGYCYDGCDNDAPNSWRNLETTVTHNGECYHVSPYWYLFGKEGRFGEDYDFRNKLFVNPDCDYTNGGCGSGAVPCNGYAQLFLPQFHKDITWGPFGSYYLGIDEVPHPAWQLPWSDAALSPVGFKSFLSSGYSDRFGYDYYPVGYISTKGTWTETKEIFVRGCIKRPIPFYVGHYDWDDIDYYVSIDPATVGTGFTLGYSGSEGCGCFNLTFDTSGMTIGDFIDGINALRASDTNCHLFAFCPGSESIKSIPASKIVNVSAESFNKLVNGFGDGPDQSTNIDIGSTITVGTKYMDMFGPSAYNISKLCNGQFVPIYPSYCSDYLGGGAANPPPRCWGGQYQTQPKVAGNFAIHKASDMWWTTMQGCDTTIASVYTTGVIPGYVNTVNVAFTDRRFDYSVSGNNYARTGFINTDKSGSGYMLSQFITDLEGISLTNPSGSNYSPFTASSGTPLKIWLDDFTRINGSTPAYGSGVGTPTAYNYSYREIPYNADLVNIFGGGRLDITAWIRRRCNWSPSLFVYEDEELPPVVPIDGTKVLSNLDCAGDEDYDDGNIIGFGCSSDVCIEEYYIEAARCGCTTVSRCNNGEPVTVKHPYNTNTPTDGSITQPTLYMCEYSIHPEYDFTMMVKVPFQINVEGVYTYQNGMFGNGVLDAGASQSLPGYAQFCTQTDPLLSNAYGWCQYIQRGMPKVPYSQIPRTDPPTAYVARRTAGVFYSKNPWNFDPRYISALQSQYTFNGAGGAFWFPDGCDIDGVDCGVAPSAPGCPNCETWDRVVNVKPMGPNGPIEAYSLTVLFRPAITTTLASDVCEETGGCQRLDINCGTACCECFFTPNTTDCCADQLSAHPYTRTTTINYNETFQQFLSCTIEHSCGFPVFLTNGTCSPACAGSTCCVANCLLGGTLTTTWSGTVTFTETNCKACDVNGGSSYCINPSNSTPTSTCGDSVDGPYCVGGCANYAGPDIPNGSPICFTCGALGWVLTVPNENYSYGIFDRGDLGSCGEQINNADQESETTATSSFNCLGGGSASYTNRVTTIYSGTSPLDDVVLGRYFPCNDFEPLTNNLTSVQSVSYTVGNTVYSSCAGSGPGGATVMEIWDWTSAFVCGYPQIAVAVNIEDTEEGFFGETGCF